MTPVHLHSSLSLPSPTQDQSEKLRAAALEALSFAVGGVGKGRSASLPTPIGIRRRAGLAQSRTTTPPSWALCFSSLLPKVDSLDGGGGCHLDGARISHSRVCSLHLEALQGKIQTEKG